MQKQQNASFLLGKDVTMVFSEVNGTDLSAFTEMEYAFADTAYADSNIFTKTLAGGGIAVTGAANDTVEVNIDAADTTALEAGEYYHELAMTDEAGMEQAAATGTVTLEASRTN